MVASENRTQEAGIAHTRSHAIRRPQIEPSFPHHRNARPAFLRMAEHTRIAETLPLVGQGLAESLIRNLHHH